MVMLPRNMISPMVSPSQRHRLHGLRVQHARAALQVVAHALAGVQARALADVQPPHSSCFAQAVAGTVDLGQAVDVRQVEAERSMPSISEAGGAAPATIALTPAGRPCFNSSGAFTSRPCTIGAPQ